VGRELVLNSLGLGGRDASTQSSVEQNLLTARADLQAAQQNLGPMHPEVQALVEKVRLTEQFLNTQQARVNQRVAELRNSQLGPWLTQMVQQKLNEARNKENILRIRFEEARDEAISLTGQMAQVELLEHDVKRLSDMNDVLLNQIASLDLKQNGQEVRVAVIEEPLMSKTQVSPKLTDTVLLTLLGGIVAALILVILLDALDDRFRSAEEMQGRLGLPLLTMVQRLVVPERTGLQALVAHAMPTSSASEGFRTLRTALTLTHPDARQIVVTSAEPGDGKTTILANLAICYAQADKRTLLIDADLRRPGLTSLLEMRGPRGLSEVLRSTNEIAQIAPMHIAPSGTRGLDILPSGPRPSDPAELLGSPRFSQLLAWAETLYDVILIDSPPTLATTDTAIIGRLVDGVLLVVQPEKNRRRLVTRVVERLGFLKIPILGLIVNHVEADEDRGYYGYRGYGYGYGYNYEYGHGDQAADENAAKGDCLHFTDAGPQNADDEETQTLIVPRRVA
jgi:capsular exopolysaccharide synthesis family protein